MKTDTNIKPLAERITQGHARPIIGRRIAELPDHRWLATFDDGYGIPHPEQNANLELFVEAFNVTHETKRTPRQLADELETWRSLRDVSHQVHRGEDGLGQDVDPTPDSVRGHLAYLQEEWDTAEKRIGQLADERAELITALNEVLSNTGWHHIEPNALAKSQNLLARLTQ